jgi:hypothetical protein
MAALQMMLQAKALGLGTCWVGGLNRAAIAGLLRIPESFEVVCLLTVGYPAEVPATASRRPRDEIVYYELYGRTRQGEDQEVLPGVPVPPPPGPREKLVSWLRRLFGRRL